MSFGVYVHIPYCLQRCIYCDFATYEAHQILPPNSYVERVKKEIAHRGPHIGPRSLDTVYFGGGTPSLLEPELLISILDTLKENGFVPKNDAEVTMEINPATLNEGKIEKLVKAGFNRFSVGAQSFDDRLLKAAHRKHNAQDTRDTLSLLKKLKVNFSLDILFALPTQTLDGLKADVDEALTFEPPHVSPYCLTVPEGHPFSKGRAPEDEQVEMFNVLEERLTSSGLERYEISNFSKPGLESRHNNLYWNDDEYWGIGLSSHSYLKRGAWGARFWNLKQIDSYTQEIDKNLPWSIETLGEAHGERLEKHQALTDFFHISLRMKKGLNPSHFMKKFGSSPEDLAGPELKSLLSGGLLTKTPEGNYTLTPQGLLISNHVFEKLTFLGSDSTRG